MSDNPLEKWAENIRYARHLRENDSGLIDVIRETVAPALADVADYAERLQAENANMKKLLEETSAFALRRDSRATALQAERDAAKAGMWQPVADGEPLKTLDPRIGIWVYEPNSRISLSTAEVEIFANLPDDVRLCRRAPSAEPEQPYPVEVHPPAHVRDQVAAQLEGEFTADELRFVVYNDTEAHDWLHAETAAPEPEPEPITQEALQAAGWEYMTDWVKGFETYWFGLGGDGRIEAHFTTDRHPQAKATMYLNKYSTWIPLEYIRTMRDLSKLVELLVGKPLPGEGADD